MVNLVMQLSAPTASTFHCTEGLSKDNVPVKNVSCYLTFSSSVHCWGYLENYYLVSTHY